MRKLCLLAASLTCLLSHAVEPIPPTWKDNPILGKVYILKETVDSLLAGAKVSISIRSVEDTLIRTEPVAAGLLLVGGSNEDDPGIYDARIPWSDLNDYLTITNEDSPLTHWQKHYSQRSDVTKPDVKPEYWHSNNFPITVYPAAAYTSERPRLFLQGSVYYLIKPSPFCKKDEFTIRLESDGKDELTRRYYERKRLESNPFEIAGQWYGSDYCASIETLLKEGVAQHGLIDPPLPDQLKWDELVALYHHEFREPAAMEQPALQPVPPKPASSPAKAVERKDFQIPNEVRGSVPKKVPGDTVDDLK